MATVAGLLCIPSSASADSGASSAYSYLADSHHNPAPLVPTSLPASIGSFNDAAATNTEKGSNYTLLFTHRTAKGFDASLMVISEGRKSLSKQKRRLRKLYRTRKTKVRGRPALAFKRKKGQGQQAVPGDEIFTGGSACSGMYRGLRLWEAAVREAGSLDQADVIGALDHAKIAVGPGGPAEMVPGQHHVRMNMYIGQVRDGAIEIVKSLGAIDPDEPPVEDPSVARV